MKRNNSSAGKTARKTLKVLMETVEARRLLSVSTPSGLTPIEVRDAYGFNDISFTSSSGSSVVGDGAGQTIAIVDPYNAKTIDSDLDVFDQAFDYDSSGQTLYQEFGAANNFLTVDSLGKGESSSGWALEVALDVEWAHAIAPAAKIDLVEANSASTTDLLAAVKDAADLPGVSVVSMSWGGSESRNESIYDSTFTTPSGHTPVTFVAAAGDNGAGAEWPASSPNVLSVGGTTLNVSSTGSYISESAWNDGGGGYSTVESEPSYQDSVNSSGFRSVPDVSYDANPDSGFSVYTSVKQGSQSGWFTVGGTSAGAPQWSALVAIADQGRTVAGETSLDGVSQTLPYLYEMSASSFHDITSGSNGYRATTGYDLATGLGSPIANLVVSNLVTPSTSTGSGSSSGTGSGTGSGSSSGSGSGSSHGQPTRLPPERFPIHFHRWDVADEATAADTVANQNLVNNIDGEAVATNTTHAIQGGEAAGNATIGTGLFDGLAVSTTHFSVSSITEQAVVTAIAPLHLLTHAASISVAGASAAPSPAQTFSAVPAAASAHAAIDNIFSAHSMAANLSAMFSQTAATIGEDGLEAAILVLPLIAFWAYQSRLAKSRAVQSLHWISMD